MIDRAETTRAAVALAQQASHHQAMWSASHNGSEMLFEQAMASEWVPVLRGGEDLLQAITGHPHVVVSYGARWCDRCAELLETLERFAMGSDSFKVYRYDLDSDPTVLDRYEEADPPPSETGRYNSEIPFTIAFHEGEEFSRFYGPEMPPGWPWPRDKKDERALDVKHGTILGPFATPEEAEAAGDAAAADLGRDGGEYEVVVHKVVDEHPPLSLADMGITRDEDLASGIFAADPPLTQEKVTELFDAWMEEKTAAAQNAPTFLERPEDADDA